MVSERPGNPNSARTEKGTVQQRIHTDRRLFARRLLERRARSAIAVHGVVVASRSAETTFPICSASRAAMTGPATSAGTMSGSQVAPSASLWAAGKVSRSTAPAVTAPGVDD